MSQMPSMPNLTKASPHPPAVGTLSSERLGNLPKDTQLMNSRAGVFRAPKPVFGMFLTLRCTVLGQENRKAFGFDIEGK